VAIVGSGGLIAGLVVEQVTNAPNGFVTVQFIVPPGLGSPGAVTIAVSVADEPSVGVEETAMLIVGAIVDIANDTELDEALK